MAVLNKVFKIADELLSMPKHTLKKEQINGRFFFEIWDEGFVERVRDIKAKASLGHDIKEDLAGLTEAYGLSPSDVEGHVVSGSPLQLLQFGLFYNPDGIDQMKFPSRMKPIMVIEVLSQDVSPDEIRDLVAGHWEDVGPMLFETTKREKFRDMDNLNLVRTWAVMCITEFSELSIEKAIAEWDERYREKRLSYGHDAVRQFRRDRQKLLERLPRTDKRG